MPLVQRDGALIRTATGLARYPCGCCPQGCNTADAASATLTINGFGGDTTTTRDEGALGLCEDLLSMSNINGSYSTEDIQFESPEVWAVFTVGNPEDHDDAGILIEKLTRTGDGFTHFTELYVTSLVAKWTCAIDGSEVNVCLTEVIVGGFVQWDRHTTVDDPEGEWESDSGGDFVFTLDNRSCELKASLVPTTLDWIADEDSDGDFSPLTWFLLPPLFDELPIADSISGTAGISE